MSREGKFVVVIAAIWLVISGIVAAHRTNLSVLVVFFASFCFVSVFVYSVARVFVEWRPRRWGATLPLAVCVVAAGIVYPVEKLIRQAIFAWVLPSYEAVVRQVESEAIPASAEFSEIPRAEREARLAYGVFARKDTNGVARVMFFTEKGFPALHSGYLYSSSGEAGADIMSRWTIVERKRSNWFYISN